MLLSVILLLLLWKLRVEESTSLELFGLERLRSSSPFSTLMCQDILKGVLSAWCSSLYPHCVQISALSLLRLDRNLVRCQYTVQIRALSFQINTQRSNMMKCWVVWLLLKIYICLFWLFWCIHSYFLTINMFLSRYPKMTSAMDEFLTANTHTIYFKGFNLRDISVWMWNQGQSKKCWYYIAHF